MIHLNLEIPDCTSRAYLEVSQQPDVSRDLMCRRAKTRQRCEDVDVDLTRICLGCDGVGVLKPRQFCDPFIQRLHFGMVAIKKSQETGLSARRSFGTAETDVISCPLEVPKIPKEFLFRHTSTKFM